MLRGAPERALNVVLADVEEFALFKAEDALKSMGANVLAIKTDVSRIEDIDTLARKTLQHYGAVHLLFNNAGVGLLGSIAANGLCPTGGG